MRALALAAACAYLAGCSNDLEKQSLVVKLRVLAVRADPPELVLPSDGGTPSTTLTALAVDPADASASLTFALCTRLGDAPPADLPCPGGAGIELPPTGPDSARLDLSDPRIMEFARQAQLDGGSFDAGGLTETLAGGVSLLIGFAATAPAGLNPDGGPPPGRGGIQRIDGFSTVTLRDETRGPPNTNPKLQGLQIAEVLDGGGDETFPPQDIPPDGGLTVRTREVTHLIPVPGPKDDPSKRYGYSFFTTAGEIGSLRSTDTTASGQPAPTWVEWKSPLDPQNVRFWVVLRDGRGGTDWIERRVDAIK